MSWVASRQPYTLAQLARRAGISEGRARALLHAKPSGLPRPDSADADGRPLWWEDTIDAWCARTGREVHADSLWINRVTTPDTPAVELQRGVVTLDGPSADLSPRPHSFYVIVWDTEHGHLVYLQCLDSTDHDPHDWMAVYAAELLEPRWWSSAVIVMPLSQQFAVNPLEFEPNAYVYSLHTAEDFPVSGHDGPLYGLRHLIRNAAGVDGPPAPRTRWHGDIDIPRLASLLGVSLPLWLKGTETVENAQQSLAYNQTFTVPDTITTWVLVEQHLSQAIDHGLPEEFPAAFAALDRYAADVFAEVHNQHQRLPDTADGWYLVCRPAQPSPPDTLSRLRTGGSGEATELDPAPMARELAELRNRERDLDVTDPRGDLYEALINLLAGDLRRTTHQQDTSPRIQRNQVTDADGSHTIIHARWHGPVIETWEQNLTTVDLDELLQRRRGARLAHRLGPGQPDRAYQDVDGRYILVASPTRQEVWFTAEWPTSLHVVSTWTDKTVLAGDGGWAGVALLALTPTDDGAMHTDPVPLPPPPDLTAFAYGYGGGSPRSTYLAIARCVLGDNPSNRDRLIERQFRNRTDGTSQLWTAIKNTDGPLRLSWPQVQLWIRSDLRTPDHKTS